MQAVRNSKKNGRGQAKNWVTSLASHATIERVRTILEQIQSLRDRSETGEGPGVRVEDVSKAYSWA
jgi:hypothetical protein